MLNIPVQSMAQETDYLKSSPLETPHNSWWTAVQYTVEVQNCLIHVKKAYELHVQDIVLI